MLYPRDQKKQSTVFHPQTDGQKEKKNSIIKAYLKAFVNWEQNNWAKLLLIAKFAYNNAKNASISYVTFKLNCGYHPKVLFNKNFNLYSRSCFADKLAEKLRELIEVFCQNLLHVQELPKRANNKGIKSRSYIPGKKVWLNSKYIKIKRNKKLESKFFRLF